MDFSALAAAVADRVRADFPEATSTIGHESATWSHDGYVASIVDRHDGLFRMRFEIDGAVDDLADLDQNDAALVDTATESVLLVLHFSRTKHFLGTNLGDDPAVKSYGDGWSYTDPDGREIFGGRFLSPLGIDAGSETTVHDAATGQNVLRLADYLADPRPTAQHKEEAEDVAQLLVAASQLPAALVIADKPDVHADLYGLGKFVYIEHARIVIRRVLELQVAIDRLNAEFAAVPVAGARIRIGIPHDGVRPKVADVRAELLAVTANAAALVRDQRIMFDASYPELHRISAVYFVRAAKDGDIHIRLTGSYDDARILAGQVNATLLDKITKSKRYAQRPLWLALFIRDEHGYSEFAINALEHRALSFAPFEALIIGDGHGVIKLAARTSSAWR